ncbi:MAG: ABC transporter substrate-binding protein [Rhodocyclaceae bacterium]|nr:ABC transporter substrate-binding protein [Rhodocyclaceae bacterium]
MRAIHHWIVVLALALSMGAHAETGVTDNRLLIGQTGAASGPLAALNQEYIGGAKLFFDQTNRSGGVAGRRIELLTLDDAYDPARAEQNARELIGNKQVFALFGCFGTGPGIKTIPVATAARVPFFAPYSGADALRPFQNSVFHLRASYGQEIEAIVTHLVNAGITQIGVAHHDDSFGRAGLEVARTVLARRGVTPALEVAIASGGDNADEVAKQVAAATPAALIMVTAGKSSAALMESLIAHDAKPMLYGLSVISANQLIQTLGPKAHGLVIAQVVPSPFRLDHAVVQQYRKAAETAKQEMSYTALEGYIAAKVFVEALRRAGTELTRTALIAALESLNGWDAGGWKISFSSTDHEASDYVDLAIISRGRYLR